MEEHNQALNHCGFCEAFITVENWRGDRCVGCHDRILRELQEDKEENEVKCAGKKCAILICPGNDTVILGGREYCSECGERFFNRQRDYNLLRREQRRLRREENNPG